MSQPSWLESSNNLEEISRPPSQSPIAHPTLLSLDVQKVRCIWLISFIQDMRTFMGSLYGVMLSTFPSLYNAVTLLHYNFQLSIEASPFSSLGSYAVELENEMLACLFSIGVILQESMSPSYEDSPEIPATNTLFLLDSILRDRQHEWSQSVSSLKVILHQSLLNLYSGGDAKVNYVSELVKVLGTLSLEARRGVEKCLLNLFYSLTKKNTLIDDGWTPDSLLSSIHGH
jgi:hypothetical protein